MSVGVRVDENPYRLLRRPVITEKSTLLAAGETRSGKAFVFEVAPAATKKMIRYAVEKIFEVKVVGVRVCNNKAKRGRIIGRGKHAWRSGSRRAFVRLAEGQDIDFMEKFGS